MMSKHHPARLTVDIDPKLHQKLKAFAAVHGMTIKEVVSAWIVDNLSVKKTPNAETLRAIEQAEHRENLEKIDLDDLLN